MSRMASRSSLLSARISRVPPVSLRTVNRHESPSVAPALLLTSMLCAAFSTLRMESERRQHVQQEHEQQQTQEQQHEQQQEQ